MVRWQQSTLKQLQEIKCRGSKIDYTFLKNFIDNEVDEVIKVQANEKFQLEAVGDDSNSRAYTLKKYVDGEITVFGDFTKLKTEEKNKLFYQHQLMLVVIDRTAVVEAEEKEEIEESESDIKERIEHLEKCIETFERSRENLYEQMNNDTDSTFVSSVAKQATVYTEEIAKTRDEIEELKKKLKK